MCIRDSHEGVVQAIVLWNTRDLGYLTVQAAAMLVQKQIGPGIDSLRAGRLGAIEVRGSQIILGTPLIINRANIDQLNF